jgi:hypothetical protein
VVVLFAVGVGHWSVRPGVLRSIRHLAAAAELDKMLLRNHAEWFAMGNMAVHVDGGASSGDRTSERCATVRGEDMAVL